jgi:hypothetical protein
MSKLKAITQMDFITVKPNITVKNLTIYAAVALFLAVTSSNIASTIGVGMMLGTMFVSYPFALSEKGNMDVLYITLSADRRTVVLGRYAFTLAIDVCAVFFSAMLASIGLLVMGGFNIGAAFWSALALSALFIVIQAIQLPLYFKFGYTKAKFASLMPFLLIMAFAAALMAMEKNVKYASIITEFFTGLVSNIGWAAFLAVLVLCLIVFLSYSLSLALYKKREF